MKKTLLAIVCGLAVSLTAAANAQAAALTPSSATYIGMVVPGVPDSPEAETIFINQLIGQTINTTATVSVGLPNDPHTFTRDDFNCAGVCDTAVTAGAVKADPPGDTTNLDVSGYQYLVAKYGAGGKDANGGFYFVWFVSGLTDVDVPNTQIPPGSTKATGGLSHYSLYNPGGTSVPDGGATLGLLGLGMMGLGYLRRRMA